MEIKLIKYQKKHYDIVIGLHKSQGSHLANVLKPNDIPRLGYLITINNVPIGAGFLRKVEGGYCLFDTLVTNGTVSSNIRHQALCILVDKIIEMAKIYKFKGILAYTMDKGILSRAQSIGFKVVDQTLMSLVL